MIQQKYLDIQNQCEILHPTTEKTFKGVGVENFSTLLTQDSDTSRKIEEDILDQRTKLHLITGRSY